MNDWLTGQLVRGKGMGEVLFEECVVRNMQLNKSWFTSSKWRSSQGNFSPIQKCIKNSSILPSAVEENERILRLDELLEGFLVEGQTVAAGRVFDGVQGSIRGRCCRRLLVGVGGGWEDGGGE